MKCDEVREYLLDFLEGNAGDRRHAIQHHLDTCLTCAREYQKLEQDMIRIRARREELAPDDKVWADFLPGVRRKISLREARRQSLMPIWRLAPLLALMLVVAFLYHMKLPAAKDQLPLEGPLLGDVGYHWVSEYDVEGLITLGLSGEDIYGQFAGEEAAEDLKTIDNWQLGGRDVFDQLLELSSEEQQRVFEELEQGLL
jgi:anti-sigma factor RsiW